MSEPNATSEMQDSPGQRSKEFEETRASLNPRSHAVKNLEMAVRRGDAFARLCAKWTRIMGPRARYVPAHQGYSSGVSKLLDKVDPNWFSNPLTDPELWEVAYEYWASGGHDRIKTELMEQLPDENRARVNKHEEEL